ncbi:sensor histidine kinase [Alicyclobacillus acidiphilus]|uniref:sensor histidine kinase n=1 Tax=Alicyclobacillus acidiphilus TaxID=182455 RepID=UPI000835C753|nr:HAMP domain-containing sensor histidine kinase [Alicyclobacillus acidiphilus]
MFRRMYVTVALLLIVSTAMLLVLLGMAVYRQLRLDLVRDGEEAMQEVVPFVRTAVQAENLFDGTGIPIRDSRGDSIYYYAPAVTPIAHSPHSPVPLSQIRGMGSLNHFETFTYDGEPYRLYTFLAAPGTSNKSIIYMYTLITEEESMLDHTLRVMWMLGSSGFILAVVGNLLLARRLVQPTYRAWTAYSESVMELSHELQTPLATVSAMLASRGVDDDTATDVRRELDRASQIVSDMLYLSRLRTGFSDRATEPVAVSDITEEVAQRFEHMAESSGLYLQGQADDGLFVETTAGEWERLVSTLFKNVIDHAARPSTAKWSLTSDTKRVRLLVENESNRDGSLVRHRPVERGIGLQIVQRLAQRMRGRTRIEQDGSRFRVEVSVPMLKIPW